MKNHTAAEWEKNKPEFATYNQMKYNEDGKTIQRVIGLVTFMHRSTQNGKTVLVKTDRNARWDAEGKCYVSTHSIRAHKYDIIFEKGNESAGAATTK